MSQILTVTRIPEEKFRRFSRFPYVAATKIDERYNNVHILSGDLNQSKKSKIKFLNSSDPKTRNREVTFDLQEKPDVISDMFETRPRVRNSSKEQVVVHEIDITEQESDDEEVIIEAGKVDWKKNSFAKLKEQYLAESREKEKRYAMSKEEELRKFNEVKHGMDDWSLISYKFPKASQSVQRKCYHSVAESEMDALKSDETADLSGKEDHLKGAGKNRRKHNVEQARCQGDRSNSARFYNRSLLELIDLGQPKPKSEDKILRAKKKPFWMVRNTRFGGDTKITAYRPSTTMDKFRNERLEVIKECPVDGLDLEEGHRIWSEVNTIINNSINKHKRMNEWQNSKDFIMQQNTNVALDTEQCLDGTDHLNYAIELRPQLGRRNASITSSTKERIWSDETDMANDIIKGKNRVTGIENIVGKDAGTKSIPEETKLRRFKHENFLAEKEDIILKTEEKRKSNKGLNADFDVAYKTVDSVINLNVNQKLGPGKIQLLYPTSVQCNTGPVIHLPTDGACNGKDITMTTTLPRISPMATPLPTGITQPPPRSHSSASMYRPYPPRELSGSFDYLRIPGRINPIAPPPPRKRINWSWETTDQHHENEKRRLLMQKREHTRYHSAWGKAFYGAPAEKEAYRRHFREVLKQQMADKNTMEKIEFKEKIRETEQAITYDRDCRTNDANEYHRKHSYLMQYRDGNKQQMEDRWANTRYSRELENRVDRERLRYNPINWSCSLK